MKRLYVVPQIDPKKGKVWLLKDNDIVCGTFKTKQLADQAKEARQNKLNKFFGDFPK